MTTYKTSEEMMSDVNRIANQVSFFMWRDGRTADDRDIEEYFARKKAAGVTDEMEQAFDRERQPETFEW